MRDLSWFKEYSLENTLNSKKDIVLNNKNNVKENVIEVNTIKGDD